MSAHPAKSFGSFRYNVDFDPSVLIAQVEAARAEALPEIGEHIRASSTAIAPLRDGTLISSAYVETDQEKAIIGYAGSVAIYAHYQHEGKDFRHTNGRQAKYLQSVMENPATAQAAADIFANKLKSRLGG